MASRRQRIYGYWLQKGKFTITPEEAEVVRQIFTYYIEGMSFSSIARKLDQLNCPTCRTAAWSRYMVSNVIKNENYIGTPELPRIISLDAYTKAQVRIIQDAHKRAQARTTRDPHKKVPVPFTGLIRCGQCNAKYIRQYNGKIIWICGTMHRKGKAACHVKQISNDVLMEKAAEALGLRHFDERVFFEEIDHISIPEPCVLIFIFKDGHAITTGWQNKRGAIKHTVATRRAISKALQENYAMKRKANSS